MSDGFLVRLHVSLGPFRGGVAITFFFLAELPKILAKGNVDMNNVFIVRFSKDGFLLSNLTRGRFCIVRVVLQNFSAKS